SAYLAKAGKTVTVLERNAWHGGGVVTRELTVPGFKHDQHSMAHIFIQANPLLKNDELGLLSKYGLKYLFPDTPMYSVFEDGTTIGQHRDPQRTAADIARFSAKDAEAYLELSRKAAEMLPMFTSQLYSPPAPTGAMSAMMDQSREGRELARLLQMSSHDLLVELFEHEKVRMHFARVAGEALVSPDEKATAVGIYVFVGFMEATG
ncbi:phytoene desaturase family protein, partial [Burkholderia cenocepacia]|uniref:phytoene desaturase family protein n=1 Tax=Burkholderia cenocepacia TaxID=95486 RepID=UPI0009CE989A